MLEVWLYHIFKHWQYDTVYDRICFSQMWVRQMMAFLSQRKQPNHMMESARMSARMNARMNARMAHIEDRALGEPCVRYRGQCIGRRLSDSLWLGSQVKGTLVEGSAPILFQKLIRKQWIVNHLSIFPSGENLLRKDQNGSDVDQLINCLLAPKLLPRLVVSQTRHSKWSRETFRCLAITGMVNIKADATHCNSSVKLQL